MQNYQMLAEYNAWANRLLYAAVGELSAEELERDTGAFFGSVFATLSHILTADRVWLNRFTGEGPKPMALVPMSGSTICVPRGWKRTIASSAIPAA